MRWLTPEWPVPSRVRAAVSLRDGGVSHGPYASLNLAAHVGDDPQAVSENRRRLRAGLGLPAEPRWLSQVHGTQVVKADVEADVEADVADPLSQPQGDAAIARVPGSVLAVLVADCLPVLLARADGGAIGIAHAGWRGLAAGVLEATVHALGTDPAQLHAWLGPAIGPAHFEVGEEVRQAFCAPAQQRAQPDLAGAEQAAGVFERNARGRWQCDLYRLARQRLRQLGVGSVHGEQRCTHAHSGDFFSYRRDGVTGRMAALLWIEPQRP